MAAIGQRLGRGAYNFAHKSYNCYLLKSHNRWGRNAIQAASLSTWVLPGDIQNNQPHGGENVCDGGSRHSYPVVDLSPLLGAAKLYDCHGFNKEYLHAVTAQYCIIEKKFPRYRCFSKCRRTFRSARPTGSERLCWGHFVSFRAYCGNGAQSEPLYKSKTGYYEILDVVPGATQAQIKTAYYKQSFIYHPDRNAGSDAATVRFSEINEAYTVLGNKALRRKYDRGLLSPSDLVATARSSGKDTSRSSAKHQPESRRSVMGAEGRGRVFDFDSFFKAHYHEQLQREKETRSRKEEMLKKKQETIEEKKLDRMLELGVCFMLAVAVAILISLKQR